MPIELIQPQGIKFFKQNKALFSKGVTATASSNQDQINNILTSDKTVKWESETAVDGTFEEITIFFPSSITISRAFIIGTNIKDIGFKRDGFGSFSGGKGLKTSILSSTFEYTDYDKNVCYFEFDPITIIQNIKIVGTLTQIPNQKKTIERVYVTNEIGTFEGFPFVTEMFNQNSTEKKVLSGNVNIQKKLETFNAGLSFKNYTFENDYNVLRNIFNENQSFLMWLCGGLESNSFKFDREPWRLQDVYNMQTKSKLKTKWKKGLYNMAFDASAKLEQSTEIL